MALPLLNTMKQIVVMPITKKEYRIRPWLVGEEKGLLLAKESDSDETKRQAIVNLIENCVEGVKFEDLSPFEFEYLFLQLRKISVNNVVEIGLKHDCGHIQKVEIDLDDDLYVEGSYENKKIILDKDLSVGVLMKEPTAKHFEKMSQIEKKTEKAFYLLRNSIDKIFDKDSVYDPKDFTAEQLDEWINSLNRDQLNSIYAFFEGLPQVSIAVEYTCDKCGGHKKEVIKGLDSFL